MILNFLLVLVIDCLYASGLIVSAIFSFLVTGKAAIDHQQSRHPHQTQVQVERIAAETLCDSNIDLTFRVNEKIIKFSIDNTECNLRCHAIVFNSKGTTQGNKPILLLHGANTGPIFWFDCVPWLVEAGYEVHCLALPGFGESIPLDSPAFLQLSSKQLLNYLLSSIDTYIKTNFTLMKPIVVGHSFGGYLASAYGCRYKDVCDSIIVSNCPGILPILGCSTMYWAVLFKLGFPNCLLRKIPDIFRAVMLLLFHLTKTEISHLTWWNVLQASAEENVGFYVVGKFVHLDWVKTSWKHSVLHELLSVCTTPVALIWGTDDTLVPLSTAHLLRTMGEGGEPVKMVGIDFCWHNPVRKNGGREFASAVVECAAASKRMMRLPEHKVAAIKRIMDESTASWSRTETLKSIRTLHTSITEIVVQHHDSQNSIVN